MLLVALVCSVCAAVTASAVEAGPANPPGAGKAPVPATPAKRDAGWERRHDGMVAEAKKGGADLLFIGDSITDGWRGAGKESWKKNFEPLKAVNFGIGGDRTEHLLWRLQNGELEGITPKLAVLMIGTNNTAAGHKPDDIAAGVTAVIATVRAKSPNTKVLLLAIFPRGAGANDAKRLNNQKVNEIIAKLDDGGKTVKYLDVNAKFLQPDGTLTKEIMPDLLHLSAKGYNIETEAILP
ncbi:MAG TPA: platelet-activating factor acetylhydrolase IB subunit, partial [Planctomycetota bacterium]|nr:platelet-activating factor acetylhydrolase IB subunit [Planctomycetota bacterium]